MIYIDIYIYIGVYIYMLYSTHRITDFATPPAFAVAILANYQHLAIGAQLQLIAAGLRIEVVQRRGIDLTIGPLQRLVESVKKAQTNQLNLWKIH